MIAHKKFFLNEIFFLIGILISLHAIPSNDFPDNLYPELDINLDLLRTHQKSDDPFVYSEDFSPSKIFISQLSWISNGHLPSEIKTQKSNNNVSITVFEKRLFMAFRTSKTHFASKKTHLYVISSLDGINWDFELEVFEKTDLREPLLAVLNGQLNFLYFKGGSNPFKFEPSYIQKMTRKSQASWTTPVSLLGKGEVPWEIKTRQGKTLLTSYRGSHYKLTGKSGLQVLFQETDDGIIFKPSSALAKSPVVYSGGVSEVGWEYDHEGNVWAVTRNEDGDENGFGSQIMFASKDRPDIWKQIGKTDPNNYMSPKMFRVGKELFLIGRKQLGKKPFDRTSSKRSFFFRRLKNWVSYSLSSKGTALYRINKTEGKIEFVMDLPGHGDNAFPSIYRLNEKEFLVANYTSALSKPNRSWIIGQLKATEIYVLKLKFE